jgi:hypothetical protein
MIQLDVAKQKQKVRDAIAAAGSPAQLIGFEAIEIQRFVTASSRPIAIHGASEAIKAFDTSVDGWPDAIFAGGGRGVLVVPARIAAERIAALKREYCSRTHGSPIAVTAVPFEPAEEKASLAWLWLRQPCERDACDAERFDLDFARGPCVDCHARPAVHRSEKPDSPDELVCERCHSMVRRGRDTLKQGSGRELWTLGDLAPDGKIAVVCADGNQLGSFFRSLPSLETLRIGSRVVTEIFTRAHGEAMRQAKEQEKELPNVALVAGGDDLKVFLPARPALKYVTALIDAVERHAAAVAAFAGDLPADAVANLCKLGIGVGLFVAPYRVPVSRLVEQARELEDDAKGVCLRSEARSAVGFAVITSDGEINDAPQPSDGREGRAMAADRWRTFVQKAEALGRVPRTQRAAASDAWELGPEERANRFLYYLARSEAWQAWFQQCGVDWRTREAALSNVPAPAMLALARLIEATP